mgnify:CR=1 FL=1
MFKFDVLLSNALVYLDTLFRVWYFFILFVLFMVSGRGARNALNTTTASLPGGQRFGSTLRASSGGHSDVLSWMVFVRNS